MSLRKFDPETLYAAHGNYFNAVEVSAGTRLVYSSGIIGATMDGSVIRDPKEQIAQAWRNVAAWLEGCGMTTDHLVRLKMHYARADYVPLSKAARVAALGEHMNCAVSGVIVGLLDPDLVLEIDVIAAAPE